MTTIDRVRQRRNQLEQEDLELREQARVERLARGREIRRSLAEKHARESAARAAHIREDLEGAYGKDIAAKLNPHGAYSLLPIWTPGRAFRGQWLAFSTWGELAQCRYREARSDRFAVGGWNDCLNGMATTRLPKRADVILAVNPTSEGARRDRTQVRAAAEAPARGKGGAETPSNRGDPGAIDGAGASPPAP